MYQFTCIEQKHQMALWFKEHSRFVGAA